eukprot:TRINITY_DN187_c0_g1_i2.p1 TRINITY_DN187_c0_g1~~TRINITY_DN187_c0_g1_i2.p1  ORF type:complete len:516 (-),score=111.55 TRINITY_DN187_c0_g1_i2:935-2449(-)
MENMDVPLIAPEEAASAAPNLFVSEAAGVAEEAPAPAEELAKVPAKYEWVIVIERLAAVAGRESVAIEDEDFGGFSFWQFWERQKKKNKREKIQILSNGRADMIQRMQKVGLSIKTRRCVAKPRNMMLFVTAPQDVLERHAEAIQFRIQLHSDFGGGFSYFVAGKINQYEIDPFTNSHFSSLQRQQLVYSLMTSPKRVGGAGLNMGSYIKKGVIESMQPLHNDPERQALLKNWVKRPWTQMQDLAPVRAYFGEKIALYFEYLGFYTRWLIIPSMLGFLVFLVQSSTGQWDHPIVPIYALLLALWSVLFTEFWKRKNAAVAYRWGMQDFEEEEPERPEYEGVEQPGLYYRNEFVSFPPDTQASTLDEFKDFNVLSNRAVLRKKSPYTSSYQRALKMGFGTPLIVTLVVVVLASTFGILMGRAAMRQKPELETWGSVISGILLSVSTMALDAIYAQVAYRLTDWGKRLYVVLSVKNSRKTFFSQRIIELRRNMKIRWWPKLLRFNL